MITFEMTYPVVIPSLSEHILKNYSQLTKHQIKLQREGTSLIIICRHIF